jgi:hypothetical protein
MGKWAVLSVGEIKKTCVCKEQYPCANQKNISRYFFLLLVSKSVGFVLEVFRLKRKHLEVTPTLALTPVLVVEKVWRCNGVCLRRTHSENGVAFERPVI